MEAKTKSLRAAAAESGREATVSFGGGARTAASQFCLAPCRQCNGVCSLLKEHPEQPHKCANGHTWY